MFRKTLEIALKQRFSDEARDLYQRIELAKKQGKLTPDLAEWAHQIRIDGKDAVHDETFSEERAHDLRAFTELILLYLFTLPKMLEDAQARRKPKPQ